MLLPSSLTIAVVGDVESGKTSYIKYMMTSAFESYDSRLIDESSLKVTTSQGDTIIRLIEGDIEGADGVMVFVGNNYYDYNESYINRLINMANNLPFLLCSNFDDIWYDKLEDITRTLDTNIQYMSSKYGRGCKHALRIIMSRIVKYGVSMIS